MIPKETSLLNKIATKSYEHPYFSALLFLLAEGLYFLTPILLKDPSQLFDQGHQKTGVGSFAEVLWTEVRLAALLLIAVVLIGWG